MAVDHCKGLFIKRADCLNLKYKYMDNQPNKQAGTGNNDEDKKDTHGNGNEPQVYKDGGPSDNRHDNEPKH